MHRIGLAVLAAALMFAVIPAAGYAALTVMQPPAAPAPAASPAPSPAGGLEHTSAGATGGPREIVEPAGRPAWHVKIGRAHV